jgi:hypothetical protein
VDRREEELARLEGQVRESLAEDIPWSMRPADAGYQVS